MLATESAARRFGAASPGDAPDGLGDQLRRLPHRPAAPGPGRDAAWPWRSPGRGSTRNRSTITTPTAPARRSTTASRPRPSRRSSASRRRTLPVSSIKGAIGHSLGAASAIEAAVCVRALREQVIPPTINHRADPELDLDYVPDAARRASGSTGCSRPRSASAGRTMPSCSGGGTMSRDPASVRRGLPDDPIGRQARHRRAR